jgi:hypothetical protein
MLLGRTAAVHGVREAGRGSHGVRVAAVLNK